MNREEAIKHLETYSTTNGSGQTTQAQHEEAKRMGIKALEQEPCDNAVSRQDVLDLAKKGVLVSNGNYESVCKAINELPSVNPQPCEDAISRENAIIRISWDFPTLEISKVKESLDKLPSVTPQPKTGHWISVSERLPELNRPLLVTTYHRVYYGHLISESGNYGYPVFRIHGLGDKNRDWVQETMSHEPYSLGRIDAWMYLDIPEPYKVDPQESEDKDADKKCTYKETGCGSCKRQLDCPIEADTAEMRTKNDI